MKPHEVETAVVLRTIGDTLKKRAQPEMSREIIALRLHEAMNGKYGPSDDPFVVNVITMLLSHESRIA